MLGLLQGHLRGAARFADGVMGDVSGGKDKRLRQSKSKKGKHEETVCVPFPDAWRAYCATNPRLRDPRALSRLVHRGVPDELRAEVWSHSLGIEIEGDSLVNLAEPEDSMLPSGIPDLIEADVLRTFPSSAPFKACDGHDRLRRVLRNFALEDAELGYVQSINFIAAIFITVFNQDRSVLLGVQKLLTKLGSRKWYTDGMLQLRADVVVLEDLVRERLPAVHEKFRAVSFDITFVCSKWFLCLFVTTLEGQSLRHVWDVLLCDGIEAVFRIALALFAQQSEAIIRAPGHDDLIFMFQDRHALSSGEALVKLAYDPALTGQLGRAELSQRRQKASTDVSMKDTRTDIARVHYSRGGVRPAAMQGRG